MSGRNTLCPTCRHRMATHGYDDDGIACNAPACECYHKFTPTEATDLAAVAHSVMLALARAHDRRWESVLTVPRTEWRFDRLCRDVSFTCSESICRGEHCTACGAEWENGVLNHNEPNCAFCVYRDEVDKYD